MAAVGGYRSAVGVPILRDGRPIGSIAITRAQAGLLPDRQLELLKTFADQAAIAIENARLFDEVQARTRECPRHWSSRPRPPTCSRSLAARPSICRQCSMRWPSPLCDYARGIDRSSAGAWALHTRSRQPTAFRLNSAPTASST